MVSRKKYKARRNPYGLGLFDALAVSCPLCYAKAGMDCVMPQSERDIYGVHGERTLYYRERRPVLIAEEEERNKIDAYNRQQRLAAHRNKLDPEKKKNPISTPELLGVGAALMSAASVVTAAMQNRKNNPDKLTAKEQAYYNKRIYHYMRQGLSGAAAGTEVKKEIAMARKRKKKNPKVGDYGSKCIKCKKKLTVPGPYCKSCFTKHMNRQLKKLEQEQKRQKKNPVLCTVGNPKKGRKKRKNFDLFGGTPKSTGKGVKVVGEITIEEAKKVLPPAKFKAAMDAHVKFHGNPPTRITVYEVPDGVESEEVVTSLGRVPEMHYFVPPDLATNKNDEGETHWVHKTKEGEQPWMAYNPYTKMTIYLPPEKGGFRVDDFLRETNE